MKFTYYSLVHLSSLCSVLFHMTKRVKNIKPNMALISK